MILPSIVGVLVSVRRPIPVIPSLAVPVLASPSLPSIVWVLVFLPKSAVLTSPVPFKAVCVLLLPKEFPKPSGAPPNHDVSGKYSTANTLSTAMPAANAAGVTCKVLHTAT